MRGDEKVLPGDWSRDSESFFFQLFGPPTSFLPYHHATNNKTDRESGLKVLLYTLSPIYHLITAGLHHVLSCPTES